jgi:FlaA1/EpsC-like NDP-sugar epimerase
MSVSRPIEVRFTGIRPGEKLFEELSTTSEGLARTAHPKIFKGSYESPHLPALRSQLDAIRELCDAGSADEVKRALSRLVPEYGEEAPHSEPPPRVNGLSQPKPAEM